jgi:FKBP-type peptidyl-prolyl cis-trans isomerase
MSCAAASRPRCLYPGLVVALLVVGISLAQAQPPQPQAGPPAPQPGAAQPGAPMPGRPPGTPFVPPPPPPPPSKSVASYNIGLMFGQQLRGANLSGRTLSLDDVTKGLRDALGGKQFERQQNMAIQSYVMAIRKAVGEENSAKAAAFLAANAKKPGVVTTASGLQYRVLTEGSGESPARTDTVTVNYTARLLDGTEFDGNFRRGGQPASFPLATMIAGWQEALMLMRPGAKWQVYIPPNLAYGMNARGMIPPGSLLQFDVELLKITKPTPPAAAATPPHPLPQANARPTVPQLQPAASQKAPASQLPLPLWAIGLITLVLVGGGAYWLFGRPR